MDNKLEKLVDFYDVVILDSLKAFMKNEKAKNEYIQMDEITFDDKIRDLDELLEYSELKELYEESVTKWNQYKEEVSKEKELRLLDCYPEDIVGDSDKKKKQQKKVIKIVKQN